MDVSPRPSSASSQEEQHHDPGESGRDGGFAHDPHDGALHEHRLVGEGLDLQIRWQRRLDARSAARIRETTSSVLAPCALRIGSSAPWCRSSGPCSSAARNRRARAPRRADRPSPIDLLDRKIVERGTTSGLPFMMIGYSSDPIFAVPLGRITFC